MRESVLSGCLTCLHETGVDAEIVDLSKSKIVDSFFSDVIWDGRQDLSLYEAILEALLVLLVLKQQCLMEVQALILRQAAIDAQ